MNGHTHEFEPTLGFPESLPASEKVLWQGSPCAWLIARRIFFLPHLFFYFLMFSCLALIVNSDVLTLKDLFVKFLYNIKFIVYTVIFSVQFDRKLVQIKLQRYDIRSSIS